MTESLLSILTEEGLSQSVDLPDDLLLKIYRTLVAVRAFDERAMQTQRQGRIGFYVPCKGSEACYLGSAAAMEADDWIFPSYRETGIPLLRGLKMRDLVGQLVGNSADLVKGRQMPNHFSFKSVHFASISSPIGTQISQAAGTAMAMKYKKKKTAVITYFGDGATSSNDFHCGLNAAGVAKAPVIFFCTNNQWAISCPVEKQTAAKTLADKAIGYGMPGIRVDGNDVFAVYKATKEAVERARRGEGPTLIEALTFRMTSHTSSDDAGKYVPAEQFKEWEAKDPLTRLKSYLFSFNLWNEAKDAALWQECRGEAAEAFKSVLEQKDLPISVIFDDVFQEIPPSLLKQREDFLTELQELGAIENRSQAFPL